MIVRRILRAMGLPVHAGWKPIHPSGFRRKCRGCGEEQGQYHLRGFEQSPWWETESEGDGSCGRKPLPIRWEVY